ncbi:Glutamine cyclotransferase [Filimonas lacunae]|uniref:Glutamine cyclotransferase n=1 Tax=Filimonas lacunae TaxID=477680 RepID=A0A173MGF5_9BACT|nr:glutaminyl-peptide cyclotransferase [Filimonas lacunae]BAV06511.1 glutamine cyclotransferase [Filimonas lacunae]SIT27222.1 Glutamine cyclotransferase [Filimonas lacunae]
MIRKLAVALFICLAFQNCNNSSESNNTDNTEPAAPSLWIDAHVVNSLPHDKSFFTEGFFMHNGLIYEGTGSPDDLPDTRSLIVTYDLKKSKPAVKAELDRKQFFGEGIVLVDNKIYQLTYKNQTGFIYNAATFKQLGSFTYTNKEGWGLTTDGASIIMSDGSDKLTWLDTTSLKPVKTLPVTENGVPLTYINELEWIKGYIYANVWTTNFIVKIDPATGKVVGKLDMNSLFTIEKNRNAQAAEMNGIAYDAANDKVYVTGKLWAGIYELSFPR